MKTIRTFITEKLKVSSNIKHGDCTLEEFLEWYYFGYTKSIYQSKGFNAQRTSYYIFLIDKILLNFTQVLFCLFGSTFH